MRAVIDTVVFVRPLITPRSRWGRILFQLVDQYTMVLSPQIVEEILDVLYRPGLRQRFPQMASPPELALVLGLLSTAEVVEPRVQLSVRRDPGDNKFLECAVEGAADCIVTEDRDLLDLANYQGIDLIDATAFIERVGTVGG